MSAQWLGLTKQLNHISRKIVYGYKTGHATSVTLYMNNPALSQEKSQKNPVVLISVA